MTKGILIHLLASAAYIIFIVFIMWGQIVYPNERAIIVIILILLQFVVAGCLNRELYDQKLK